MSWKPGEPIFLDLEQLKQELETEEPQESCDGERMVKSLYLGTVFSLMPSGKFYTPWACSNVEPCPKCEGECTVPSRASKMGDKRVAFHRIIQDADHAMRGLAMDWYGPACDGKWPGPLRNALAHTERAIDLLEASRECPDCEGMGSVEAMLDEAWREQADKELGKIDAWLENGEGDPCDLFVVTNAEEEEED